MPYVFGAGFLVGGGETGPETRAGNDCANFLVYAWRRCGRRIGWCDPLRLRRHLDLVASDLSADSQTEIDAAMIERGLAVHCGKHIAAVWEDREPLGFLDGRDIVAHHLSGAPELVTLRQLLADRPQPTYDLLTMPPMDAGFSIIAGGDICLSESAPLAVPSFVAEADLAVANLECALTARREPARDKTYLFRAPPSVAHQLAVAGFDACSLANNHTGDFGSVGREDTANALRKAGLRDFGLEPWNFKGAPNGELAFYGINFVENESVDEEAAVLARNIARAKSDGRTVIVFPHWGREHTGETTPEQRRRARWLIDCGADVVLGSGPHCRQPLDFYRGRPVFYSLGNAYFPPRGPVPLGFHQAHWARISVAPGGHLWAGWDS
jgi:poly-gamma-glutamate synthesis protein (capsule biosynthesis protein)